MSVLTGKEMVRILIVDDHPIVRRGLSQVIGDQPDLEVCGEADDPIGAMTLFDETHPDLVIVDISLKQGSGLELIKQIRNRKPDSKVLVASMHSETLFAEPALRAGAMGYINKQQATEHITEAIRQVLAGRIYLSPKMADKLLYRVINSDANGDRSPFGALSGRELEVLQFIGQGLTSRQIADNLHLSPKTVETHRENIKKKLNLSNSAELACRAVQWVLQNE